MANALYALDLLKIECRYDVFHDRRYVGGEILKDHVGQVTDDVCLFIRALCRQSFGFDPGKEHMWDATNLKCRLSSFHPVKDYLLSLSFEWDGKPRIDTWMTDYLGTPDTPLIRTISRLVLVASVRRIFEPGCKWDYMPVLYGPENKAKSLTLATLYGQENFSDQKIIGVSDKELAEAVRGRWGVENPELAGMKKADIDHLKAQVSRQTDRVRPAYGRAVVDVPRECVLWGTANAYTFLRFAHGNRRFIPVSVPGMVKIAELAADRDQLWAEAVQAEYQHGPSLALPDDVWEEAQRVQEEHTEADPWDETLYDVSERAAHEAALARRRNLNAPNQPQEAICYQRILPNEQAKPPNPDAPNGVERISSAWLLNKALSVPVERQIPASTQRLATRMKLLGWSHPHTMKIGGRPQRGFERALTAAAAAAREPDVEAMAEAEPDFGPQERVTLGYA